MSSPKVRILDDAEAVSRAAAELFVASAHAAVARHGRFAVALAGGSTPRRAYQLLAEEPYVGAVRWPRVEFFWGDERAVPPDHADSNFRMANEALLLQLPVPAANLHRMPAELPNRPAAAELYQAELARVLMTPVGGEPPALDLVLLGMGADGHTASLFPGTDALNDTARWVVPNFVPKLNAHRLTLTYRAINRARCVCFLVAGGDKAATLAEVLNGPPDPQRLPSQAVRPTAGELIWLADRAAAAALAKS
jgi:6-phosphogluconolactonase